MNKENNLNEYSDEIIPIEHKKIIKCAFFTMIIIEVIVGIITIFYHNLCTALIFFPLGSFASVILFYYSHKIIDSTHYLNYKKAIKKIHLSYQLTYVVLFVISAFTKSIFAVIFLLLGLLIIKLSSLFTTIKKKIK